MKYLAVVYVMALAAPVVYMVAFFEDPSICERAEQRAATLETCRMRGDCHVTVSDLRIVERLQERCTRYRQ